MNGAAHRMSFGIHSNRARLSIMKVDKDRFDALLGKLMQTPPQPAKSIETTGKAGKIVPPISPQSTPRKA